MHASHLNNIVEMPIQTRYFPCAGTHGDPKNRLPRRAQSSTLHSMHIKYIHDISETFLALVGSKGCLTCFRGAGSSPDHHPSGAPRGRLAKKCMKERWVKNCVSFFLRPLPLVSDQLRTRNSRNLRCDSILKFPTPRRKFVVIIDSVT